MIDIRVLHDPQDLEVAVDTELAVWGMEMRFAVPSNLMHAISMGGGVVLGAYDGERMVGMSLALPARREDRWRLWSHMTGVIPGYQGQRIGFRLKQTQRSWALDNGYEEMGWTFDPLQRGNANFNMNRLGTTANRFHVNLYGAMTDSINQGMDSDRLEAAWELRDARVAALAAGETPPPLAPTCPDGAFLVRSDNTGDLIANPSASGACLFVEIPYHLEQVKQESIETARRWQLAVRDALQSAFGRGYQIVDFVSQPPRCWYVLGQRTG